MARTHVVGLDLGSRCVRAAEVELRTGGSGTRVRLLRFGEQPVDPSHVRDGEVVRPGPVSAALRALWKRERFGTREVVMGVGNQRVFVRDLSLRAAPLDQLRASLRYGPVQDLLPVRVEDCLLDFHPVSATEGGQVHGMLVAAPEETVEANTSAVTAAGLRPVRVDLNAFALMRALVHGPLLEEVVGIVDIGASITDVVVVDRGVLRMYRTLATASDDMTSAVRQAAVVTEQQAEEIKRQVGIVGAVGAPPEVAAGVQAMTRRAQALGESIRTSFGYYAASAGRPVGRLLLAGRGALPPGLGQFLSTALGIPAAFATADAHVELGRGVSADRVAGEVRPVLPVALGLAQGAVA